MMKKKTSVLDKLSSVVFLWIAFGLGVIAVLFMFVPALDVGRSAIASSANLFFTDYPVANAGWPIFMGYMLIVLASLLAGYIALPIVHPSIKTEKIILFVSILAFVAGALLVFLTKPIFLSNSGIEMKDFYLYRSYAGPYLAGSFAVASALCTGFALKLDW